MSFLTDIYSGKFKGTGATQIPQISKFNQTRALPNAGGFYSAIQGTTPTQEVPQAPPVAPVQSPVYTPPVAPTAPQPTAPTVNKYINPATGTPYTPQEYANVVVGKIPTSKNTGDIGTYAGGQLTSPDQTTAQLTSSARDLAGTRNDIATGATQPYDITKGGTIVYNPQERAAIEKAYAGIYDPALNDVFAKIEAQNKKEEMETSQAFEMQKLAKQHEYAMAEKGAGTGSGYGTAGAEEYVPGVDPIVDSYVERINRGESAAEVFRNIPGVANQGLRNRISMALNATKYDSAKALGSLDIVNKINQLITNPELSAISGPVDQFTGGLFGEAAKAKALYNQINAKVQLIGTAELAKGQGAISNFERDLFGSAATALPRGLGDKQFKKELINMKSGLSLASGLSVPMKVTDIKTGESEVMTLDREGAKLAEKNGLMVEGAE